jgi:hypothetical protein
MNIKNKIQQLKTSGVRLTEIANATGYSAGYVSKVYREHIDPAPKFRSAFKTFLLDKEIPKSTVDSLASVNPELRKLVQQLQNKLDEIKTIIGEQEQAKVNN